MFIPGFLCEMFQMALNRGRHTMPGKKWRQRRKKGEWKKLHILDKKKMLDVDGGVTKWVGPGSKNDGHGWRCG